jgi:hypothetical protein
MAARRAKMIAATRVTLAMMGKTVGGVGGTLADVALETLIEGPPK